MSGIGETTETMATMVAEIEGGHGENIIRFVLRS
jgi:hypothetical protein